MKKNLQLATKIFWITICFLAVSVGNVFSQSEITVDEGFNTLYDAVVANPGATLILKRGGSYVNDKQVEINTATIIRGETEPAETAPAVISYFADPGLAGGKHLFAIGADFTIMNVGCLGFTFDDQQIGAIFQITVPDITVTLDGLVLQGANWIMDAGSGDNLTITHKNMVVFNLCHVGWDNYGGFGTLGGNDHVNYTAVNNTYFVAGRILGCLANGPHGSEHMEHNTYVNIWGELYYPTFQENFVVKNNIMFNSSMRGYVGLRTNEEGDTTWVGDFSDFSSTKKRDSLQGDIVITPMTIDTTTQGRNVVVANNLRFTEQKVFDNQKEATGGPQPFINDSVLSCFAEYGWTLENNILQENGDVVDPEWQMGTIPDSAYVWQFKERLERSVPAELQGEGFPYLLSWRPNGVSTGTFVWPLPIDFKPTNKTVWNKASDGYPLGDLNWFGADVVTAWENGDPSPVEIPTGIKNVQYEFGLKNFPNPAAYATKISYTLEKSDKVTLSVYNAVGTEIATLVNSKQIAGNHDVNFNTSNLSSGVYFYKIQVGGFSEIQKMMVAR